jgi:hypothetical protein
VADVTVPSYVLHKRKAGAFLTGELRAGEVGVDTSTGDLYTSVDGIAISRHIQGSPSWNDLMDKPSTFPPSVHTHGLGDLEQGGATIGQTVRWNGSAWSAGDPFDQTLNIADVVAFKGLTLTETVAANTPFTVKGAASQTGDLTAWRDSVGADLVTLKSTGELNFASASSRTIKFAGSGLVSAGNNSNLTLQTSSSNGKIELDSSDGVEVLLRSVSEGTFRIKHDGQSVWVFDPVVRQIEVGTTQRAGVWNIKGKDGNNSGLDGCGFSLQGGDVSGGGGSPGSIYFRGGQNPNTLAEGNVHFGIDSSGVTRGRVLVGTIIDDGNNLLQVAGDISAEGAISATTLSGALSPWDLEQSGATSGQGLVWNGSAWVPTDLAVGGGLGASGPITVPAAVIWAEENSSLSITSNGGRQWSFGNGSESDQGLTLHDSMKLSAVSFTCPSGGATATVDIEKNGVSVYSFSFSGSSVYEALPTPVDFVAGDRINFITTSVSSSNSGSVISAYFQKDLSVDYLEPAPATGFAARGVASGEHIIASDTWVRVPAAVFDTTEWDTDAAWDGSTWTCPDTGVYDFNGHVTVKGLSDTKKMVVGLYKNGVLYALFSRGSGGLDDLSNPIWSGFGGSITVPMTAGDTAEIYVHCNEASPVLNGDNGYCHFAAYRVDEMTASPAILDDTSSRTDKTYSSSKIDSQIAAITKADIGLENVDNTADASKSVAYAGAAGSASILAAGGDSVTAASAQKVIDDVGDLTALTTASSDTLVNAINEIVSETVHEADVTHGATASTARPIAQRVRWFGTVAPSNAVDGDIWIDTN